MAREGARQSAAADEPQDQVQQQLEKAKAKVQKIQLRIANVRNGFLHKATAAISKNKAVVFVEDLQVGNLSKSAE
ncbi:MAG: hypothetical protein J2P21_06160 [Chloracidobacterium sp.]|nr:hypothetical protein [Chloracidobacterium sp.]